MRALLALLSVLWIGCTPEHLVDDCGIRFRGQRRSLMGVGEIHWQPLYVAAAADRKGCQSLFIANNNGVTAKQANYILQQAKYILHHAQFSMHDTSSSKMKSKISSSTLPLLSG